ncbi:MAG: DUF5916 domain-containing protein [Bacteroidales bacterium]|nr:DUF5916 domain-containing protein [Bacteroidales bacterium]
MKDPRIHIITGDITKLSATVIMRGFLCLMIMLMLAVIEVYPQTDIPKKRVAAVRITAPPKIDGILNDSSWIHAAPAGDFVQVEPVFGRAASFRTEVRFIHDDNALYIGAMMYDPAPDSILKELSVRDEISNTDYFGVSIDPFNDALVSYEFMVTVAGVQVDSKSLGIEGQDDFDEDRSWDAVWYSRTQITDNGWVAEIKIPYFALRFPEKGSEAWGMNCFRQIRRYREISSWNPVDRKVLGVNNQAGELTEITKIKSPLRLALIPYVSGYVTKVPDKDTWGFSYKGGMDLIYGINDSYTLDMILIPDFGQVESDEEIYNLSPFEVYYEEKRPFFTEGTELFDKGDVFYSRRVGGTPDGYFSVSENLRENEKIIKNPEEAQMLNATKITGKNPKGLAIGFFNGMTANTYATVKDTITGEKRNILTVPFSNYNMLVLEQSLNNNSFVSIFNTNVVRPRENYCANVTGSDFRLINKPNTYGMEGNVIVSQKYTEGSAPGYGYSHYIAAGKTSGNFTFTLSNELKTDTYDPNDMGYLQHNNEIENELEFEYNLYDPFGIFIEMQNSLYLEYSSLYKPLKYTEFGFGQHTYATFRNYLSLSIENYYRPIDEHDYYEPRVDGWYYTLPPIWAISGFLSPDYRKRFIADVLGEYYLTNLDHQRGYTLTVSPRLRISDKLFITLSLGYSVDLNDKGYVADSLNPGGQEVIIFGKRDVTNVTNSLTSRYIFNNKMSLSLKVRHYWKLGIYEKFYDLQTDGHLIPNDYSSDEDFSYNAFTIDMAYKWEFSPGSEIAIVWKNAIDLFNADDVNESYFQNLDHTLSSPATNSISLRILYYIDSQYFKKKHEI